MHNGRYWVHERGHNGADDAFKGWVSEKKCESRIGLASGWECVKCQCQLMQSRVSFRYKLGPPKDPSSGVSTEDEANLFVDAFQIRSLLLLLSGSPLYSFVCGSVNDAGLRVGDVNQAQDPTRRLQHGPQVLHESTRL